MYEYVTGVEIRVVFTASARTRWAVSRVEPVGVPAFMAGDCVPVPPRLPAAQGAPRKGNHAHLIGCVLVHSCNYDRGEGVGNPKRALVIHEASECRLNQVCFGLFVGRESRSPERGHHDAAGRSAGDPKDPEQKDEHNSA